MLRCFFTISAFSFLLTYLPLTVLLTLPSPHTLLGFVSTLITEHAVCSFTCLLMHTRCFCSFRLHSQATQPGFISFLACVLVGFTYLFPSHLDASSAVSVIVLMLQFLWNPVMPNSLKATCEERADGTLAASLSGHILLHAVFRSGFCPPGQQTGLSPRGLLHFILWRTGN